MKTTKVLSVFSLIIVIMLMASSMAYASLDHPEVYVNNEKIDKITRGGAFEARVSPIGITYVPFRPIFEKFNMNVYWDQETKSVTASGRDMTIVLTQDAYYALVNGKKQKLLSPPFFDPDRQILYVNLRFIAETLGAKVTWVKKGTNAAIYIEASDVVNIGVPIERWQIS